MLWGAGGEKPRWREGLVMLGGDRGITSGHWKGGHNGPLEVQLLGMKGTTMPLTMPKQMSSSIVFATGGGCKRWLLKPLG